MKITTHPSTSTIATAYTRVAFDTSRDYVTLDVSPDGAKRIVLGLEGKLPLNRRRLITLIRQVVREAKARKVTKLALELSSFGGLEGYALESCDLVRLLAENIHLTSYEYAEYKTKKEKTPLTEVMLVGTFDVSMKKALTQGDIVAHETNACRDLANTPGGDMTPSVLAKRIQASARGTGATVTVLNMKAMVKLGMGAILGVARGATAEPKFIIVEYRGAKKGTKPVVLVGKGITFDTGGLSLKGADHMLDMHLDMSGGAAVAHAVIAVARLKLPVHAVALIPAVENAVSGESYRPGDILRSMSGKTIDVLNTDAEGRLVLADALTYAKKYTPSILIDVATLTGAALVALGTKASAILTKDDGLAEKLSALGEVSGDYVWRLPLWEEYKDMVKGRFGDVANVATESPRYGGTIGGGMFLAEFAEGRWAHIDMAPRMTSDSGDCLAPGAAGAPVRLLVRLLEDEASRHKK